MEIETRQCFYAVFSWNEWESLWCEAAEDALGSSLLFAHTSSVSLLRIGHGGASMARVAWRCGPGSSLLYQIHGSTEWKHLFLLRGGAGGEFRALSSVCSSATAPSCSAASGYKTKLLQDAY